MSLFIDGKEVQFKEGQSVLRACLDAGVYVPHLCAIDGEEDPGASCRLCMVEIEGYPQPFAACSIKVTEGLKVRTDT